MSHQLKSADLVVAALILSLAVSLNPTPYSSLPTLAQETTNQASKVEADRLLQQGRQKLQTYQLGIALQSLQQALAIYRALKDQQGEKNALDNLALVYYLLEDYPRVIDYQQQSLVITRKLKDRQGERDILGNLGNAYFSLGDYPKAIAYQQQSLAIAREFKNRLLEGGALSSLGNAYHALGDYPKAIDYHKQSLTIAREIKDRQLEGRALNGLGIAYASLGNYPKAIDYHKQSLDIREANDLIGKRYAWGNLGGVYYAMGDYPKAISYYQQILATSQKFGDQEGDSSTLDNLGSAYYFMGDYPKAIDYHQKSLVVARQLKNPRGESSALGNLGRAYSSLGDYPKAIDYYQQSLAIARQTKHREGEENALHGLGTIYYDLGNSLKAIDYYQQSLSITQQIKYPEGKRGALLGLGNAHYALRNDQKALEYYQQSLVVARQIQNRQGEGTALGGLGLVYNELKDYSKAIDYYQQSLAIVRKLQDPIGEGAAMGNLGLVYSELGNYRKAISYEQQALLIFRQAGDRAKEGLTLSNIGNVFIKQNQPELAIVFYKQSINVRESIRQQARKLPREEQQSYTQSVSHIYRNLANLLLQRKRLMEALQVLDLLKVQELQDFFKDVKGNKRTAQGIEMLSEEQQLLQHLNTTPSLNLNEYLKSSSVTSLVQQLRQTAEAQNLKLAAYTDLQTRLQNLGANSALLYPLILDDRIELVLFTHNTPPLNRTTNIKQTELEQAVKSFRAAIQQKDSQNVRQPANQLYNWLIKPIEADLQQANIKTLIYAPDGQMRYVPLAALYDGKKWLVEKYQINYITALSLTNIATRSPQPPHILAGAFTDLAGSVRVNGQAFDFGAIPSALSEVESLAKQFPNTTKLVNKDFNHAGMTFDRLNHYNIVHLATHGKLVAGAPEDSFILLNNNEYITLREIKDWKLPNVALVVLSACQTALGDKLGSGIEIIGFGYQLQQAQARASIATLWEINDASTGSLMNEFYAQLQTKQLPPVEALREAQITLITGKNQTSGASKSRTSVNYSSGQNPTATINRDLSHPYYWAPFILIGNGL